jgi:hypothetical protein
MKVNRYGDVSADCDFDALGAKGQDVFRSREGHGISGHVVPTEFRDEMSTKMQDESVPSGAD